MRNNSIKNFITKSRLISILCFMLNIIRCSENGGYVNPSFIGENEDTSSSFIAESQDTSSSFIGENEDTRLEFLFKEYYRALKDKDCEDRFRIEHTKNMKTMEDFINTEKLSINWMPFYNYPIKMFQSLKSFNKLTDLEIHMSYKISSDPNFKEIFKLKNLKRLKLKTYTYEEEGCLNGVENLKNLESLSLANFDKDPISFHKIAKLSSLKNLKLSGFKLKDSDIEILTSLTSLTTLDLSFNENLTKVGYDHLSKLKLIEKLKLCSNDIKGDDTLQVLSELKNLKVLDLSHNRFLSPKTVSDVIKMPSLSSLDLFTYVTPTYKLLSMITNEPSNIEYLNLRGNDNLTNLELSNLFNVCKNLKTLNLERLCEIRNKRDFLKDINELSSLEELNLYEYGELHEGDLKNILQLKSLKVLNLGYCMIPTGALNGLGELKLLTELTLDNNPKISKENMKEIYKLEKLKYLSINHSCYMGDNLYGIDQLENLIYLNIGDNDIMDSEVIMNISKLKNLKVLVMRPYKFESKAISKNIGKLTNLRELYFRGFGNSLEQSDFDEILKLKNLEILSLNLKYIKNLDFTFEKITLLEKLTHLNIDKENELDLTLDEMKAISSLPNLCELNINIFKKDDTYLQKKEIVDNMKKKGIMVFGGISLREDSEA